MVFEVQFIIGLNRIYPSDNNSFFMSSSSSDLIPIKCGVPQQSTLGPLLFLLYINDLNSVFNKVITIHFADDTHLSYASKQLCTIESVTNYKLKKQVEQLRSNKLCLNSGKSELVIFRSKTQKVLHEITIKINKSKLSPVPMLIILAQFLTSFFSGLLT